MSVKLTLYTFSSHKEQPKEGTSLNNLIGRKGKQTPIFRR